MLLAAVLASVCVQGRPFVFGYAAWWVPQGETVRSLPLVDRIKFIEVRIDALGHLPERNGWPTQWEQLRRATVQAGVPLDVALTQFSTPDFEALFGNQKNVDRFLAEALALAADPAVAGLHLDVEMLGPVNAAAVANYRRFVQALSGRLKALQPARLLSVFLSQGATPPIYDTATLAVADHVIAQGYDAHWLHSEVAGPVAPLRGADAITWERVWKQAQAQGLPPQRVLMGFPAFGYEWKVNPCNPRGARLAPGETTTFGRVSLPMAPQLRHSVVERVLAYGVTHDSASGSAYYTVPTEGGGCAVGWFEDWWTLEQKLDWVLQEHLAGVAFFPLGYDNTDLVALAARRFRTSTQP